MREIKFRAWYDDIGYGLSEPFYIGGYPTWSGKTLSMWRYRAMVEQFTGIHDKNGTEIYEGDIVNAGYHNLSVNVDGIPRVVHMGKGDDSDCYVHCEWLGWKAGGSSLLDVHKDCEIIGNIHENHDLLG